MKIKKVEYLKHLNQKKYNKYLNWVTKILLIKNISVYYEFMYIMFLKWTYIKRQRPQMKKPCSLMLAETNDSSSVVG